MEAVLSGVSAGVIGLDRQRAHHARQPLGAEAAGPATEPSSSAASSPRPCRSSRPAGRRPSRRTRPAAAPGDAHHQRRGAQLRRARDARGSRARSDDGSVLTFDDVTELVAAQRTSAWADVARRIAHEIKNPLTPIQLSAERIRRKYGKVITEDRETFDRCTDTIIRQVGDVTRMVDEFSAFARMPKPQMEDARHPRRGARRRARPADGRRRHRLRHQGRQASRSSSPATAA